MADPLQLAQQAEGLFAAGDVEGFLGLFADDGQFCIPGRTPVSGDHDKDSFRGVLKRMAAAISDGNYQPEVVCRYGDGSGAVTIFDNHVVVGGEPVMYHSAHEWIVRDGQLAVLLVYLHEFERFEAAWA